MYVAELLKSTGHLQLIYRFRTVKRENHFKFEPKLNVYKMRKTTLQWFTVSVTAIVTIAFFTSSDYLKKGRYYTDEEIAALKKEWAAPSKSVSNQNIIIPMLPTGTLSRDACTSIILDAKKTKGVTYQQIADAVGRSETWTTSVIYGENTMDATEAKKMCDFLGLSADVMNAVQTYAYRGDSQEMPPTDPLIYRFYEINMIYGKTMRAIIHEKFGEGIMSAIDYNMNIEKIPNPNGDRIRVTMEGKYLQYKKW